VNAIVFTVYSQTMTCRAASAFAAVVPVLACALAGSASAATGPAGTSVWTETRLTSEWAGPLAASGSIRPQRIRTLASGPALIDIHWTSWSRTAATGRGFIQACPGCGPEHGYAVRISVLGAREFSCGDPAQSIGHWFSKVRVKGPQGNRLYRVYQDGHPNAC
jgi:hypothetical protein